MAGSSCAARTTRYCVRARAIERSSASTPPVIPSGRSGARSERHSRRRGCSRPNRAAARAARPVPPPGDGGHYRDGARHGGQAGTAVPRRPRRRRRHPDRVNADARADRDRTRRHARRRVAGRDGGDVARGRRRSAGADGPALSAGRASSDAAHALLRPGERWTRDVQGYQRRGGAQQHRDRRVEPARLERASGGRDGRRPAPPRLADGTGRGLCVPARRHRDGLVSARRPGPRGGRPATRSRR